MKTLFLKNGMPIATAVLAISGAFATTSMQSSSSSGVFVPTVGYVIPECEIAVLCCDVPSSQICRLSYPNGLIAAGKDPIMGQCVRTLWRYVPY